MKIDGCLCNCQSIGNLFVAITIPDQPEHLQFTSRKIFVSQMLDEAGGRLRWNLGRPE